MSLIKFQDYPSTETPLNAENLNHNFNELNKANTYSTEEQVIGTWINGKKIYRKVINCGAMPNNGLKEVAHNINNINFITNYYGIAYRDTDSVSFKLPYISFPTESGIAIYINKTSIVITTVIDRSSITEAYITIEYTKTTD